MKQNLALAALIFLTPLAQGSLIAYEGFDTTNANGSDASAAGVTGSGFSGYGATNFRMDLENGLGYTDSLGNTLNVTGKAAGMDTLVAGTQNLQLVLSSTIANSGTLSMSFLMDVTAVATWGVAGGLQDAAVTDFASPTAAHEAVFRSTSSNWGIFASDNTGSTSNGIDRRTGPTVGIGSFLFIAELNMDTETMTGYLNPTNLADVAGSAAHTITDTATGTWDSMTHFIFSLGGDEAGTIDEIRLGDTLGDVTPFTPVPEPGTSLLALLAAPLLLRRRR